MGGGRGGNPKELQNECAQEKTCLKISLKVGSFYKWIAGGPRPLVTQKCQEKWQRQEGSSCTTSSHNKWHWNRKDAASLEASYGCCHGDQMMYTFICMFKHSFISHQPVLNSNSKNSRTSSPWTPSTTPGRAWSLPTTGRGRWRRPLTRTATVKQQQQQQERRPLHREFLLSAQAGNGAEAAHTKYQEVQAECRVL